MDKSVDIKYESLKKSVNNAIKLLCNKIEDMKKEVKELKAEQVENNKDACKSCDCNKTTENIRNRVERIEVKMEEMIKENKQTSSESNIKENIVENITNVKRIDSEIKELKKTQTKNVENIRLISENIAALEQSQEAQKKSEQDKMGLVRKQSIEIEDLVRKMEIISTAKTSDDSQYICRQCDEKFTLKEGLRNHIIHKHSTQFHCETCGHEFEGSVALEQHMITKHNAEKKYKCDICKNDFVADWRLRKHKKMHMKTNARKCHYYNNMKECPFSYLGCKFLHEKSDMCKFNGNCKLEKCQFQHSKPTNNY